MSGVKKTGNKTGPASSGTTNISPARLAALRALQLFRRQGTEELVRCEREDDSRLAERLFYGVLQNERFLDACIVHYLSSSRPHPYVMDLLRLGAYQILFLDRIPDSAAVNDAVQSCRISKQRYAAGMVNAVLRKISRDKALLLRTDEGADLALRYSHPDWLVEKLLREQDPVFVRDFLESNQNLPDLCLQMNTLRTNPETFIGMLKEKGIVPLRVREDFPSVVISSRRVDTLPGFEEGLFYVQDNAARASVKMIGLMPGMRVLDACAAPGGKSIAAALEGAKVLSCDVNASRLARCSENYQRLKLDIPTRQLDATEYCPDFHETFDAVIADVPCSGSGVIRRHPEIRKRSLQEVEELLSLQSRILDNLAEYVRPGGTLLYSTCSVLQDENEKQLAAFLERKPVFRLTSTKLDGFDCENGMLRSWPHRNGNDGFFAARLVKKNDGYSFSVA